MAKTYVPIATYTASGSVAFIDFSSIPATYTDLVLVVTGGLTSSIQDFAMRFNSDTGSNYSATNIWGSGSTYGSVRFANQTLLFIENASAMDGSNTYNAVYHIMNYANTTTYKTAIGRSNMVVSGRGVDLGVGLWRSTAAITNIRAMSAGGINFTSVSTFTLYGIAAA